MLQLIPIQLVNAESVSAEKAHTMGTIKKRETGKGKAVFDATVRRKGLPSTYKTFKRLTDAKLWIQDIESDMRAGRYQPEAEAAHHTIAEAVDRFIREELPRRQRVSAADQERQLLWLKELFGYKLLSEFSPALLNEARNTFLSGNNRHGQPRKPQSWNRCLSTLSVLFKTCVSEWDWMEFNPARRVRREREARGRVRFLSDDERTKLLEVCREHRSPNLYPLVVLTLSTGMRKSEALWLHWSQIDLAGGALILDQTKNGERRRVPIKGLSLELLKEHGRVRRLDTDLVFAGKETARTKRPFALDHYWREVVRDAGLSDFRFHDLRHSCASYLAMSGASLLEIAEVL